jgi:NAD(P)-dependent dehydrogenase (short-subunit alcohol dehydrogenase family)
VTGGGSGIGAATVACLQGQGGAVAVLDRVRPAGDTTSEGGAAPAWIETDVRSWSSTSSGMLQAVRALGGLDVLVCSAGVASRGTVEQTDPEAWEEVFAVNVRGVYLAVKAALPHLREGTSPSIVIVASQLGLVASRANAAYCASKGAALQLTRALALDCVGEGIRVNAVCPGATRTPMTMRHYADVGDRDEQSAQLIGRLIEPAEIAEAVAFLAGPASSAIVGASLVVDGGYIIH